MAERAAPLPDPRPDPNEKIVRVFETEEEPEALVVHGLLESAGIENDMIGLDFPPDVIPIGGVAILVREEDAERARQIVRESQRTPSEELEREALQAADGSENEPNEQPSGNRKSEK
jgi:Putative prokaryotic signal transducing protein